MQNNRLKLVEMTADGSPTLRMGGNAQNPDYTEQMHYSTGAASETIYIYGEAIRRAQSFIQSEQTQYLVVGLGLGYIEILVSLMTNFKFKHILSFEKDADLIHDFTQWLDDRDLNRPSELYDQVAQALQFQLPSDFALNLIQDTLKARLTIRSALNHASNDTSDQFNVICYDAFSSKMEKQLWDFDFLNTFIQAYCAKECVFASYAKTGALNRALKQNGFTLIERKGFSTKRESTLAIRQ